MEANVLCIRISTVLRWRYKRDKFPTSRTAHSQNRSGGKVVAKPPWYENSRHVATWIHPWLRSIVRSMLKNMQSWGAWKNSRSKTRWRRVKSYCQQLYVKEVYKYYDKIFERHEGICGELYKIISTKRISMATLPSTNERTNTKNYEKFINIKEKLNYQTCMAQYDYYKHEPLKCTINV